MAKIVRGQPRTRLVTNATAEERIAIKAFLRASQKNLVLPSDFSSPSTTQDRLSFLTHPAIVRPYRHESLQKPPLLSLLDVRKRKAQNDAFTRLLRKQRKTDAAVFAKPFFPKQENAALVSHPCFVSDFTLQQPTPTVAATTVAAAIPTLPGFSKTPVKRQPSKGRKGQRPRVPRPSTAALNLTEALLSQLYPQA